MSPIKVSTRLWGSLAHVPTITLIWVSYLVYRCLADSAFMGRVFQFGWSNIQSPPITPIILTLLGIPISLTIMQLKKRSDFIRNNAQQAYFFNVWLLKRYGLLFAISFMGVYLSYKPLLVGSSVVGIVISVICLQQSIAGIVTALRGRVYHYWYLGKLFQ
jgi:hypothetical protein